MQANDKLLWVKFGWSHLYCGDPVDGNFRYLIAGGTGLESWNFLPGPDGNYYGYVPPSGRYAGKPSNPDPYGWTVVCLAKYPTRSGIHVVGWYEQATLLGRYERRPDAPGKGPVSQDGWSDAPCYSIWAPTAFLVPVSARTQPFSHSSVRTAKYSFLVGPNFASNPKKRDVLPILQRELKRLRPLAIANPVGAGQTRSSPQARAPERHPSFLKRVLRGKRA